MAIKQLTVRLKKKLDTNKTNTKESLNKKPYVLSKNKNKIFFDMLHDNFEMKFDGVRLMYCCAR